MGSIFEDALHGQIERAVDVDVRLEGGVAFDGFAVEQVADEAAGAEDFVALFFAGDDLADQSFVTGVFHQVARGSDAAVHGDGGVPDVEVVGPVEDGVRLGDGVRRDDGVDHELEADFALEAAQREDVGDHLLAEVSATPQTPDSLAMLSASRLTMTISICLSQFL